MTNIIFDGVDLSKLDDTVQPERTAPIAWRDAGVKKVKNNYVFTNVPYPDGVYNIEWTNTYRTNNVELLRLGKIAGMHRESIPSVMDYARTLAAAKYAGDETFLDMIKDDFGRDFYTDTRIDRLIDTVTVFHNGEDFMYSMRDDPYHKYLSLLYGLPIEESEFMHLGRMTSNSGIPHQSTDVKIHYTSNIDIAPIHNKEQLSAHQIIKRRVS